MQGQKELQNLAKFLSARSTRSTYHLFKEGHPTHATHVVKCNFDWLKCVVLKSLAVLFLSPILVIANIIAVLCWLCSFHGVMSWVLNSCLSHRSLYLLRTNFQQEKSSWCTTSISGMNVWMLNMIFIHSWNRKLKPEFSSITAVDRMMKVRVTLSQYLQLVR